MNSLSFRIDPPTVPADSPVAESEVRTVRQQVAMLVGRCSLRLAESRQVEPSRIGPSAENACGAPVVPQLADGRFVLVVRYRSALAKWSLEFPRGCCDDADETWRKSCDRVLEAAIGWVAGGMALLGSIQVDSSCLAARSILALGLACTSERDVAWDPNQMIAGCIMVTPQVLDALIRRGDVECSATLSALTLVRLHLAEAMQAAAKNHVPCVV